MQENNVEVAKRAGAAWAILWSELEEAISRWRGRPALPGLSGPERWRHAADLGRGFLLLAREALVIGLLVAAIAAMLWLFLWRGWSPTHWLSGWIGHTATLAGYVLLLLATVVAMAYRGFRNLGPEKIAPATAGFGLIFGLAFFVGCMRVLFTGWRNPQSLADPETQITFHTSLLMAVFFLGAFAFYFKRMSKLWYGVTEIAVALASTWFLVDKIVAKHEAGTQEWVAVGAAVYVFSRGFGNTFEGIEEKQKNKHA